MKVISRLLSGALLLTIVACSGGGGGGGSSDNSSDQYGIRLLHGAIDAQPADLSCITGEILTQQAASFAKEVGYTRLGEGAQSCNVVVRSSIQQPATTFTFESKKEERRTVLLFEANSTVAYNAVIFQDLIPSVGDTEAAIRVVHGVRGVEGLDASVGGSLVSLPRATASEYLVVPAGPVAVRVEDRNNPILDTSYTLEAGKAYTLFVTGEESYFIVGRLLVD